MRESTGGPYHRHILDQHQPTFPYRPQQSESVDTLTTTATGSQHTVSAEAVEVEEHEGGFDGEFETRETLKLTARSPFQRDAYTSTRRPSISTRGRARDETTQEIQDEDEATLRELLIRWKNIVEERRSQSDKQCDAASDRQIRGERIFEQGYLGRCPL